MAWDGFNAGIASLAEALKARRQHSVEEQRAQALLNYSQDQGKKDHLADLAALAAQDPRLQQVGQAPTASTPGRPPVAGQPDPLAPLPQSKPPQPQPPMGGGVRPPMGGGQPIEGFRPGPNGTPQQTGGTGGDIGNGVMDPRREADRILTNMTTSMKAANPKADPLTIIKAVESRIEDVKGIAPLTKAMMQGQIAMYGTSIKQQMWNQRLQKDWAIVDEKQRHDAVEEDLRQAAIDLGWGRVREQEEANIRTNETGVEKTKMNIGSREKIAGANINSRMSIAQLIQNGLNGRSAALIKAKGGEALLKNATSLVSSGMFNGTLNDAINQLSGAGKQVESTPAPKGGGGGVVRVKTPEDVKKLPRGTKWISADGTHQGTT